MEKTRTEIVLKTGLSPVEVLQAYVKEVPEKKSVFHEALYALKTYYEKQLQDEQRLEEIKAELNPVRIEPEDENQRKFTIWTNEDAGDDADVLSYIEGNEEDSLGLTLDELRQRCLEDNDQNMEDEESNLTYAYRKKYGEDILHLLVIADIGWWNGRRKAYKAYRAKTIKQIFHIYCGDDIRIYGDGKDLRAIDGHHDATNYYLLRRILPEYIDEIEDLLPNLGDTEKLETFLSAYTESLWPVAAECYGWSLETDDGNRG